MKGKLFAAAIGMILCGTYGAIAFGKSDGLADGASSGNEASVEDERISGEKTGFYVEGVTPQGELSASVKFPSIQVVFSEPVVPLAKLGEPSDRSDAVTITPAVKGVFRWYGTGILSFDATDELIPQKKYTVRVNQKLVSLKGEKISGQTAFSFQTEPLRLVSVEPGHLEREKHVFLDSDDIPPEYARNIAVAFSNKVNPAVVSQFLAVKGKPEGGKAESFEFSCKAIDEKTVLLSVKKDFPRNCAVRVVLAEGAVPDADCVATKKKQEKTFHTLRPLAFRAADGGSELHVSFNHRIQEGTEGQIFDALTFSPAMEVPREKLELRGNTIFVHDIPVTFGETYSFSLKAGAVCDIYGQTYGADISQKISVPDADSFASFKNSGMVVLESQFAPHYAFEYQNILSPSSYTVTPVCGVTDSFALPAGKTETLAAGKEQKNRRTVQSVPLADFLESVGGEKRGAVHFEGTVSYEGYSRRKNDHAEAKNDTLIQVTDLGATIHSAWDKASVLVTSLRTGKPVADAEVRILYVAPAKDGVGNQVKSMMAALTGNAEVRATGRTDADGLCVLQFDGKVEDFYGSGLYVEVRTKGHDDRLVQRLPRYWENPSPRMVACIFSDRGLYRPGETATVQVIDRNLHLGTYEAYTGDWEITFSDGSWRNAKTYAAVQGKASPNGTLTAQWKIPEDAKPGTYYIRYARRGGSDKDAAGREQSATETISVQFFERLRFQADAEIAPMVYTRGDALSATVTASYLGGGSLAGGTVHGDWSREATNFVPAGKQFEGMAFGPILNNYYWKQGEAYDGFHDEGEAVLGEDGTARLSVSTGSEPKEGAAYAYRIEAQVTDRGNQMVAARTSAVVHPASFYIGLSDMLGVRGFAKKGEKLSFECALATPEGLFPQNAMLSKDRKISWTLSRKIWQEVPFTDEYGYEQIRWEEVSVVESTGELSVPKNGKNVGFSVTPAEGGRYLLALNARDSAGRTALTERTFFVTGSDAYRRNDGDGLSIELTADKDEYEPGETAQILLNGTLPSGTYLVTTEREGLVDEKILRLSEPTAVISVPITEKLVPAAWVSVSTVAGRTGDAPSDYDTGDTHKPRSVSGSVMLSVSKKSRRFDISVETDRKTYRPADSARLTLTATKNGKPVEGAELTVLMVDRGVLDLIGYHVKNPIDFFYNTGLFNSRVDRGDSRHVLIDPVTYGTYTTSAREQARLYFTNRMMKAASPMMADMAMVEDNAMMVEAPAEAGAGSAPVVRKDFRATALFKSGIVTDRNGRATVECVLPDSLTEYIVTVIGVKEQDFACTESPLVAANPISARDVETRLLRPDDDGEAGVVVTNIGDSDENVQVDFAVFAGLEKTGFVQGTGELVRQPGRASVVGAASCSAKVQSGSTGTLMFRLRAEEAGWITLAFTVRSGSLHEVIYRPLEIEKPFVYESVTTVGEVRGDEAAVEQVVLPSDADENCASLFVQLDSSRLGTLSSAVDYVFRYPYGCLEQRSSAVMPLIAFGEHITVFGLESEVKDPAEVAAKEIASWADLQKKDGGFPYWKDGRESSLPVSLRIAEIISLAREHGIALPAALNESRLAAYIEGEIARLKKEGRWYPFAYAWYVLSRMGKKVPSAALEELVAERTGASELAFAGLAALNTGNRALAEKAAAKLKNMISLTARGASFQTDIPWGFWHFYNGNAERYALALHLFTALDAEDRWNGHLVYELLEMQKAGKGRWQSTAMTSRVLIALDAYIRANRLADTDFGAQALLNGKPIAEGSFKGAGALPVSKTLDVGTASPDAFLTGMMIPLAFKKDGTGTLFYTASLRYAIPAGQQKARDEGLCVYTEITDARTGEKVSADALESGKIYRQKVHVSTTKERTFVAVRAPVPAGCEILNSAFATTATVPPTGQGDATDTTGAGSAGNTGSASGAATRLWQTRWGMSHQDVYDAEIRCFWNYLAIGSHSFEFLFRAQRKGRYQTPAVTAECMYEPEIFGRSDGKLWKVE